MTFSDFVKDFCHKKGISYRKFAAMCGLSASTISQIINEINPYTGKKYDFNLRTYAAVADGSNISLHDLLSLLEEQPIPKEIINHVPDQAPPAIPITDDEAYLLSLYRGMSDTGRALLVSSA